MNRKLEFSKKLLILDYIIAGIFITLFFICEGINGIYTINITNQMIQSGIDMSMISITQPFNLDTFSTLLNAWIIQLGISSGAYYWMCKSDHKIQLPMKLINDIPEDIREDLDMTTIITSALNCTDN